MAVEPHSLAWLAGQRGPDRSGESWGDLMAKWPFVERVVADAGKGIERGVKRANEARAPPTRRGVPRCEGTARSSSAHVS